MKISIHILRAHLPLPLVIHRLVQRLFTSTGWHFHLWNPKVTHLTMAGSHIWRTWESESNRYNSPLTHAMIWKCAEINGVTLSVSSSSPDANMPSSFLHIRGITQRRFASVCPTHRHTQGGHTGCSNKPWQFCQCLSDLLKHYLGRRVAQAGSTTWNNSSCRVSVIHVKVPCWYH